MTWPRLGRGPVGSRIPRFNHRWRAAVQRQQSPRPNPVSQPRVLPGPSSSVPEIAPLPRAAPATTGSTTATAAAPSEEDPPASPNTATGCPSARKLPFLGVLQICLGCTMMALGFGALSLGRAPQVKNACPVWAGASVILCGILSVVLWKKPRMALANLFVLLSIICILLSMASFVVTCQGMKFVSSVPQCDVVDMGQDKICVCCEKFGLAKCAEETALKLYHAKSCSKARLFLKKTLFILCALSAFSTTVCLSAAALRFLDILAIRRSRRDESRTEVQDYSDDSDFDPSVPPPGYFSTSCSLTRRRTSGSVVIPLPHIHGVRIKGAEVFFSVDPPSYEDVVRQSNSEQECALPVRAVQAGGSGNAGVSQASQGAELSCKAATQTEVERQVSTVALQSSLGSPLTVRRLSLFSKISYRDVERLAAWIIEQSPRRMSPDLRELVKNIKPILKPDEGPGEVSISATFLEQAMAPAQQAMLWNAPAVAFKKRCGLLQLESGGVTMDELAEGRIQAVDD